MVISLSPVISEFGIYERKSNLFQDLPHFRVIIESIQKILLPQAEEIAVPHAADVCCTPVPVFTDVKQGDFPEVATVREGR